MTAPTALSREPWKPTPPFPTMASSPGSHRLSSAAPARSTSTTSPSTSRNAPYSSDPGPTPRSTWISWTARPRGTLAVISSTANGNWKISPWSGPFPCMAAASTRTPFSISCSLSGEGNGRTSVSYINGGSRFSRRGRGTKSNKNKYNEKSTNKRGYPIFVRGDLFQNYLTRQ